MRADAPPAAARDRAVWLASTLPDASLLRARYVKQVFPRHFHESFVVCVNERGAHRSWFQGAMQTIPQYAVTVVPPGEVHTGQPVPGVPWDYRAMYLGTDMLGTLSREVMLRGTQGPTFRTLSLDDAALADAFVRAHRAHERGDDPFAAEEGLVGVLSALIRRHAMGWRSGAEQPPADKAVRRAVEFLNDFFADRITLAGLARAVGLSNYVVLRSFRRVVGITPHAYLTQVRVERARLLLKSGMAIAAVAARVGFADQSHLTRHFHRLVGVTPGALVRGGRRHV